MLPLCLLDFHCPFSSMYDFFFFLLLVWFSKSVWKRKGLVGVFFSAMSATKNMYSKSVGTLPLYSSMVGLVSLCFVPRCAKNIRTGRKKCACQHQGENKIRGQTKHRSTSPCSLCTAGNPLLLLVCRNRIHYQDTGLRRGCLDKHSYSHYHQSAPAISIWLELQSSWSVVGTQMLKLSYLFHDGPKLLS